MADVQGPDALGPFELVRRDAQQVHAQNIHVEAQVGRRLNRVGVQQDALVGSDDGGELPDRLDRADLVVGEHHADEDRLGSDRGFQVVRVHAAVPIRRQLDDLEAELLQVAQRVTDRVVLDCGADDSVPARLAGPGRALDGQVVRLGTPGREHDLAGLGAESAGHSLAGVVETGTRPPAERVRGRRIPEVVAQPGQHRLERLVAQGRGSGVVKVDGHGAILRPYPV